MKVLQRGHRYSLWHVDGENATIIQFVNKEPGTECEGVTTQEILRMLIDRTHYCNNCLPHWVNEQIIWHFRQAIALHEARALLQKTARGEFLPEQAAIDLDGHFLLDQKRYVDQNKEELVLVPPSPLTAKPECNHRCTE